MNRSQLDTLTAARAYIAKGWTQRMLAVNKDGEWTAPNDAEAVSWCINGALCAAAPGDNAFANFMGVDFSVNPKWGEAQRLLLDLLALDHPRDIPKWNDEKGRTQEEVLAVFDVAIEKCKAELGLLG